VPNPDFEYTQAISIKASVDEGRTRLIVRFRQHWEPGLGNSLMFGIPDELGSLLMQPKTLRGIRDRAEAAALGHVK
jgi:hypothetical protein